MAQTEFRKFEKNLDVKFKSVYKNWTVLIKAYGLRYRQELEEGFCVDLQDKPLNVRLRVDR